MSGIRRWPEHKPMKPLRGAAFIETLHPGVRAQFERVLVPFQHETRIRAVPLTRAPNHVSEGAR